MATEETTNRYRIVRFEAENVKRLRVIDITPEGDVVIIGGDNAQGKTSVLDAIWLALGGAAALKGQTEPVRKGMPGASVRLDLGRLVVTRTWTADGRTTLRVANSEGQQFNSPQKVLDQLVGQLSFDPLAFANAPAKEQRATLLGLVELPFDPDELETERKAIFDERTEANRQVKFYQANYDGMPGDELAAPTTIDVAEAMRLFTEAERKNGAYMEVQRSLEDMRRHLNTTDDDVARLTMQLAEARDRQVRLQKDLDVMEEQFSGYEEIDMEPFKAGIMAANEAVQRDRENANKLAARESLEAQKVISTELTNKLGKIEQRKLDGISSAAMPVDGLGFDEDGVLYNGFPFSQASGAEQLRVSMAIAIAANPSMRIMRITDGSLLDKTNMALIQDFAAENDVQVWIERVGDADESAIVIEDGLVKDSSTS